MTETPCYRTLEDAKQARTLIRRAVADNRITMEQLAKAIGLSVHHCYTIISTAKNHTPISHQTWNRLDQMIGEINKWEKLSLNSTKTATKTDKISKTHTMGMTTNPL